MSSPPIATSASTPASLREALELIASGRVRVDDLVTDVLPLADFAEGLARYRSRPGAEGGVPALTGMRAAIFHGPGDVRIESVPVADPGPGEVLVRVAAALTDGTDAKCYLRGHPVLLGEPPSPFGHEYAGTVAAVGTGTRFAVGEPSPAPTPRPAMRAAAAGRPRGALRRAFPLLNGAYAE